jgi:hypothetical protein
MTIQLTPVISSLAPTETAPVGRGMSTPIMMIDQAAYLPNVNVPTPRALKEDLGTVIVRVFDIDMLFRYNQDLATHAITAAVTAYFFRSATPNWCLEMGQNIEFRANEVDEIAMENLPFHLEDDYTSTLCQCVQVTPCNNCKAVGAQRDLFVQMIDDVLHKIHFPLHACPNPHLVTEVSIDPIGPQDIAVRFYGGLSSPISMV